MFGEGSEKEEIRKKMDESIYATLDDLEQFLRSKGVTRDELEADDTGSNAHRSGYACSETATIVLPDGGMVTLVADSRMRGKCVTAFLDELSMEDFCAIWFGECDKAQKTAYALKRLLRHPGGQHEWLMIAAVPVLKAMEIPMECVKEVRTPTAGTYFYISGDKCWHGETGSNIFHTSLLQHIRTAYVEYGEWCKENPSALASQYAREALRILREQLEDFAAQYYPSVEERPTALQEFITAVR